MISHRQGETFARHISIKVLEARYRRNVQNAVMKKSTQFKNGQKDLNKYFMEEKQHRQQ